MSGAYGVPVVSSQICSTKDNRSGTSEPTANDLPPFQLSPKEYRANKSYYGVRIVTGKLDAILTGGRSMYITIIGSVASSSKMKVDVSFWGFDDLIIEADGNLGNILVVEIADHHTWHDKKPVHVSFVTVHDFQSDSCEDFPCYHWVGNEESVSFTAHTTTLQDVSHIPILVRQRDHQIAQRQKQYQWQKFQQTGLPSAIAIDETNTKELPIDERFDLVKSIDFTTDAINGAAKITVKGALICLDHLYNYEELAKILGKPDPAIFDASRWTSDVEFGRQMLNGVNPVVIHKCEALPANFPVSEEMVKGFLCRSLSLSEEMKNGHMYLCDLKIMEGLPCKKGFYAAAPLCLLYVNGNDQLVPIAIQLKQESGEDNPIFTPTDHWIDWLLAKMFYQSAHGQFHELITHYFSCHAAMEAYAVATSRNLPDPHPIYKLLHPHFRFTMAINSKARATLINNGGIIDMLSSIGGPGKVQLMRRGSKVYSVYSTNIKRSVKERGVADPIQLPGYFYRDDGLKVWNALEEFIRSVLNEFYSNDDSVKADTELQNWAEDIHVNGFPGYFGASDGHSFPKQIQTKEDLVDICTLVAFTGSAQHAAVNFGQYDIYGFVPNAPFEMRLPPPTKKGVTSLQKLIDTLPDSESSRMAIVMTHLLSQYSQNEIFLGHYPSKRFTETKVQHLIQECTIALQTISEGIQERNKTLDMPYPFFLQDRVPNSITI